MSPDQSIREIQKLKKDLFNMRFNIGNTNDKKST